MRIKNLNTTPY